MTIKEYREQTPLKEQREFAKKLQAWLSPYTNEVYKRVMCKMDEIIDNDFTLNLINELYEREQKEIEDETDNILYSLGYMDDIKTYGLHNDCLTHSKSYRDVLYDMYIREKKEEA